MNEIKCPKCNEVFKVDETGFADIVKQVRDKEFQKELNERVSLMEQDKENAVKLAEEKTKNELQEDSYKKDSIIADLKATIKSFENEKDLAVTKAVANVSKELNEFKLQAANKETEYQSKINQYESTIKYKEDEIERIKNMKKELSTKAIGESLEQYCLNEFNKIRAAAFPNAFFSKDNDASTGTKGDFIFRYPAEGVESISIMFEMKNESEDTAVKQKNESFLARLDKDRNDKNCEYAILVTTLEADNDLYNQGILDVSHIFPKMYIIRPQFFIPMITLLKNAAEKSFEIKNELAVIRNQNIDITTFEEDVTNWKNSWLATMTNAGKRHQEAITQIDKAIEDLVKVKEALTLSDKHLLAAENKMDDLTVKRLTRKNPTMAAKFAELKSEKEEQDSVDY